MPVSRSERRTGLEDDQGIYYEVRFWDVPASRDDWIARWGPSVGPDSTIEERSGWVYPTMPNRRTDDLIRIERKIMAYRQVQQDTTAQLYGVSSALLASNDRALTAVLRQLERFGYDLERVQFIAQDEPALSGQVRQAYDRFAGVALDGPARRISRSRSTLRLGSGSQGPLW